MGLVHDEQIELERLEIVTVALALDVIKADHQIRIGLSEQVAERNILFHAAGGTGGDR